MNHPDTHRTDPEDFVRTLRATAPYVHAHRGRVFVINVGGEAVADERFERLIYDIALLQSLGARIVLVHGARPQIDALLAERGLAPRLHADHRITDEAALACVKAAVGAVRMEIEARLSTSLASTPMGGARVRVASGNWVTARPLGVRDGVDLQHTGEVRRIAADAIRADLDAGRIVLISPVGYSPTGEIFNLRAEDVATAVASALGADKLIFLIPGDPRQLALAADAGDVGQLPLSRARALLGDESPSEHTIDRRFIRAVVDAAEHGVQRVHLIADNQDGALLRELYTRDGSGLMIDADDAYETTRQAGIDDIGGILALIQPLEREGALVPRSREQLELNLEHFSVMVRDGYVIACYALFPFAEAGAAEFACIAVHPDYRRAGRAAALLRRAEDSARRAGLRQLFALTTQTPHWFVEHGFVRVGLDELPVERRELYNYRRNSIVLKKTLQTP